jgi:hypothetical protein
VRVSKRDVLNILFVVDITTNFESIMYLTQQKVVSVSVSFMGCKIAKV